MKQKDLFRFGVAVLVLSLLGVSSSGAPGQQADSGVQVWLDDMQAVSYRARVEGDWLVVEATHEPGWHTYSMDNVIRAREKSGKMRPETELPTVITPLDGLTIQGDWRQSPPLDLSTPDIRWYTWGFEDTARFGARVEQTEDGKEAIVTIRAQACNASACQIVDGLRLRVEFSASDLAPPDNPEAVNPLAGLVPAQSSGTD